MEGVNPLRPYYRAPVIGETTEPISISTAYHYDSANATSGARYASRARNVFADIDYKGYLDDSSPSVMKNVKEFLDELMWKYTSVLMAQPFEVAKTILQARDQGDRASLMLAKPDGLQRQGSGPVRSLHDYHDTDSDSEGDEAAYFTSNMPGTPTPSFGRHSTRHRPLSPSEPSDVQNRPTIPQHYINLGRQNSIFDVIGQLWQKDGAWGVWKGSNATFLYTVLQSLLESWTRSFLSAIFNVSDLGVKDDMDRLIDVASPYPWASLFVAATAAVTTGVLLSPLDLVRTRLVMTPVSHGQRRTIATLRALPSYRCPAAIAVPTVLNSLVHPLLTLSTPLMLRSRFLIDSQMSPMTFSVAKFFASSAAILVKLPIETVLRRGQMAVLSGQHYVRALAGREQKLDTIVPLGQYNGVFGTMYHITTEEGTRENPAETRSRDKRTKASKDKLHQPTRFKGQGLEGLWRGWKVSWWGLVGLWVAGAVGNGGEGEF